MVSNERFADIWNSSSNTKEVAKRSGLKQVSCSGKAYDLRKRGVHMKVMKAGNCGKAVADMKAGEPSVVQKLRQKAQDLMNQSAALAHLADQVEAAL